MILDKH